MINKPIICKCFIEFWVFKIRVLKKCFSNFALSDAEDNNTALFSREGVADLPLLRTLFPGSNGLSCFISKCKFDSFKNTFAMITSLSELNFRFRRFVLLLQMRKVISMAETSENHGDYRGLISYLWCVIYALILTWNQSQNSLAAAEALSLKMSSHGTLLKQ